MLSPPWSLKENPVKLLIEIDDTDWSKMEDLADQATMGAACAADVLKDLIEAKFGKDSVITLKPAEPRYTLC